MLRSKDDPQRKVSLEYLIRVFMEKFQGDLAGTGVKLAAVMGQACRSVANVERVENADGTFSDRLIPLVEPGTLGLVRLPGFVSPVPPVCRCSLTSFALRCRS